MVNCIDIFLPYWSTTSGLSKDQMKTYKSVAYKYEKPICFQSDTFKKLYIHSGCKYIFTQAKNFFALRLKKNWFCAHKTKEEIWEIGELELRKIRNIAEKYDNIGEKYEKYEKKLWEILEKIAEKCEKYC